LQPILTEILYTLSSQTSDNIQCTCIYRTGSRNDTRLYSIFVI
jgi:hypothetical protein